MAKEMAISKKTLDSQEITDQLKTLPHWRKGSDALVRTVEFPRYLDGLAFVGRVAHEAEKADHHPMITLDYKKVIIKFSTHDPHGITELDFQAAHATEKLIRVE